MSVEPQAHDGPEIENLFAETRTFPPDPAFTAQANATAALYDEAEADYEAFWAAPGARAARLVDAVHHDARVGPPVRQVVRRRRAERRLQLRRPPRRGGPRRQGRVPLDRRARRHPDAHLRATSCARVSKAANALQELGVTKGDRVAIYMPMIPELPIAMLACARIGAPHTVVFGGFSAEALSGRINDCGAKVLITADGGWRRGKKVGLKHHADEAVADTPDDRARASSSTASATAPTWSRAATTGGTTSSSASPEDCAAGPVDSRAHALPALHVGHDREAEGDPPHDGRLPRRRRRSPTGPCSTSSPTTSTGARPTSAG